MRYGLHYLDHVKAMFSPDNSTLIWNKHKKNYNKTILTQIDDNNIKH